MTSIRAPIVFGSDSKPAELRIAEIQLAIVALDRRIEENGDDPKLLEHLQCEHDLLFDDLEAAIDEKFAQCSPEDWIALGLPQARGEVAS